MRNAVSTRHLWIFGFSLLFASLPEVLGEEAQATAAEPRTNRDDEFTQLTKLVPEYVLQSEGERAKPFQLVSAPILRWTNPVRKVRDGAVFLWLDGERPAAIMCAFWRGSSDSQFKHEFHSLHSEPFRGTLLRELVWRPNEAGVSFRAVRGSPKVAGSERLRLVQMRQIASTYQGSIVPTDRPVEQLRLLSQPLYRYVSHGATPGLVDGAIFAFVQTTDPEILILLEAREDSSGAAGWHIAFVRMSRWPLQLSCASEVVWSCDLGVRNRRTEEPYYVLVHTVEHSQ